MPKNHLPTYAIVELLIRLSNHSHTVGDYKNHSFYDDGVVVKTTSGSITFDHQLIIRQFEHPETITEQELIKIAESFNPGK